MYTIPILNRPKSIRHGEAAFVISKSNYLKNEEKAIGTRLIVDRSLFGNVYRTLLPTYFNAMPLDSGVMIQQVVPTHHIFPSVSYPGDIDLLIIPFHANQLVLSMTLAIEIKVVRATFRKPGRSPGTFGFSQAEGLIKAGVPFVAVAHFIVSDESPKEHWEEILVAKVIDSKKLTVEEPQPMICDMLPADLVERCYGRLTSNCQMDKLGLLSAYMSTSNQIIWFPMGRAASRSELESKDAMDAIGKYYNENASSFLETLRYDPK